MGWLGRMLGGPLGDYVEDKITGADEEDEDENVVVRKVRKINKYIGRSGGRIPGTPGPIVERWDVLRPNKSDGRSVFDAIFADPVKPEVGSIVCCDLAGGLDHTGIYVGRRRIIHRDGDGYLAAVSPEEFLDRLGGFNNAINIFVACDKDGDPVGDEDIAKEARAALKNPRCRKGYNLVTKNCHQFCRYCINGDDEGTVRTCTFRSLEGVMRRELGFKRWRRWDF